jgi:hypothetical protein
MATENDSNNSTEETSDQEQAPKGEAPKEPQAPVIDKSTKLPDDHPLVTAHATVKTKLATTATELTEARAQAAKATQLEEELGKRPTQEAVDTLQKRYDRLEAFLQGAGGDLAKALDSRTFTRQLFETEDDVADIVKNWHKNHPSATAQALGGAAAKPGDKKPVQNDLLRAAIG